MNELRTLLERKADQMWIAAEPPPDLIRRTRRHRVRTGVVSVVLAVGMLGAGTFLIRELVDGAPLQQASRIPARQSAPLWPSSYQADLDSLQASVDDGHQPWYADDPEAVARVFAGEIIGWDDVHTTILSSAPTLVAIRDGHASEKIGEAPPPTLVTLARWRGRPDGIFVVTKAESNAIGLASPLPGEDFGRNLVFEGTLRFIPRSGGVLRVGTSHFSFGSDGRGSTEVPAEPAFRVTFPDDFVAVDSPIAEVQLLEGEDVIAYTAYRLGSYIGSAPSEPGDTSGSASTPQYEFDHITVRPGEGPGQVLVHYTYDFDGYPGVHQCTWRALAPSGRVVGERTLMFAPLEPSTGLNDEGIASNAVELRANGTAVRGEVSCDPERLDTPNITNTQPYPSGLDRDGATQMIEERVRAWAERFDVADMDDRLEAANLAALELAVASLTSRLGGGTGPGWLEVEELLTRSKLLKHGEIGRVRLDRV